MLHKLRLTQSHFHPIIYLTCALIAGIWWQESSGKFCHFCALLTGAVFVAFLTQNTLRNKILLFCLMISIFTVGAVTLFAQHKNHSHQQKSLCAQPCSIRGVITNIEPSGNPAINSCLSIDLSEITCSYNTWHPHEGAIQLYTRYNKEFEVGHTLEIQELTFRKTEGTPFDNYLTRHHITATTFSRDPQYTILYRPLWCIGRTVWHWRDTICRKIKSKLSCRTSSLFLLTFLGTNLGNKKAAQKTKDLFKIWGILHFLARSGLHLVIFIMIWELLLGFIPLPYLLKQVLLIIISGLYCLLSWPSLPFIRAFATFLLYKIGLWTNARGSSLYLLCFICFIMLLFNPAQLLFLDFQLSFGLTFVLAWFSQLQQQKRVFKQKLLIEG